MHIDRYEKYWLILVSIVLAIFFAALVAGAVIYGVRLPAPAGMVNPLTIDDTEYAQTGVRLLGQTEDGQPHYEIRFMAEKWRFVVEGEHVSGDATHPVITIPEGSTVTFVAVSRDTTHGFMIERHNINFMLIPGQVSRQTSTFNEPGEYGMLCHEFCGVNHQGMWMTLVVEPAEASDVVAQNQES